MNGAFLFAETAGKAMIAVSWVDMAIIVVYFVLVLGIGVYLKRFAKTGEDFFLAGRGMTAWVAGLAFISTNLGSQETIGYSSSTYQHGMLMNHAYWIGAIPAIVFLALVMMPFYHICRTHSVPGYLKLRYGEAVAGTVGHLLPLPDDLHERHQHVRPGQGHEGHSRLGPGLQHLGGVADGGRLRHAGRAACRPSSTKCSSSSSSGSGSS